MNQNNVDQKPPLPNAIAKRFSAAAKSYDAISNAQWRTGLACLKALGPAPYVLDLGCGSGKLSAQLARQLNTRQLDLLDLSPAMLSQARQRLERELPEIQLSTYCQDIQTFSANNRANKKAYDLVFSHFAFQWLCSSEALFNALSLAKAQAKQQLSISFPIDGSLSALDHALADQGIKHLLKHRLPDKRMVLEHANNLGLNHQFHHYQSNEMPPLQALRVIKQMGASAKTQPQQHALFALRHSLKPVRLDWQVIQLTWPAL
ncbi:MAG: methyltransferase domain-containing protein [Pseudomonadota bacterium]|nr:methyltransferase domain-containing protein [Pseudomonadota bacterium]